MTDQDETTVGLKPFAAFLQEQRGGSLHGELSEKLYELVSRVAATRGKGSLTLTIAVAPNKDGVTMTVSDKVALKAPEVDRGAAIFFVQGDGNLVRDDPRQMKISDLRVVDEKPAEPRVLGGDA